MIHPYYRYFPWKGIDKGDGKYRLFRSISSNVPSRLRYSKGTLMTRFTKFKLLRIAWRSGVTNYEGFSIMDAYMFHLKYEESFALFIEGWNNIKKNDLILHIWNHLQDTENIIRR